MAPLRRLAGLSALAALFLGAAGADLAAKTEDIRVMSFNIRMQLKPDTGKLTWESRKGSCVKAIKKNKPDVVGLQEVKAGPKEFFVKSLPKYLIVDRSGKPGIPNPGADNDQNPIFFRADRLELLDYGSFWLNEDQTPDKRGWDAANVRNATWVKLKVRKSGLIFFYFNTHFDHLGKVARLNSSKLMVEKAKEIAGDNAVVFLNADFNMPCTDAKFKPLKDYLSVAELEVRKADKAPTFNGFGKEGGDGMWLDHILFRNARVMSFEVVDEKKYDVKYISDHYPVYSDFQVKLPKGK